jgi:hypothetical protein
MGYPLPPISAMPQKPAAKPAPKPSQLQAPSSIHGTPQFSIKGPSPKGMISPGNIDIANRPSVYNPETGGYSTIWSTSVNIGGKEILIPRVSKSGKIMSVQEAIEEYKKTGEHLGIFTSPDEATAYAQKLHEDQESRGQSPAPVPTAR